jgi:hypothetical protein
MKVVFPRLPARRPRVAVAVLVGLGLLLSACGGNEFTYVGTSSEQVYFKVPSEWTKYNKKQLLVATGLSESPQADQAFRWLVGYDADPDPAIGHILGLDTQHPAVLAWVRELDFQSRDSFSLATIRNAVFPVDQLLQNQQADILSAEDVVLKGGIRGVKLVYNISGGNFTIAEGNKVFRINQVGFVDPDTNLFYLFILKCTASCYQHNQRLIDQVADSFTVRER